jgi:predicted TIM-barrel fold metal-dependent hydrolase
MEQMIVVSSDSHAGVPKELWSEYLDPKFHELLPQLKADNETYPTAIFLLSAKGGSTSGVAEVEEAHASGWHGLHDPVLRIADMDREGVAAELIYHGDFRLGDLFHNNTNRVWAIEAWDAGARAWNHWCADNFGFARDRFMVVAAMGPCTNLDTAIADLRWNAAHDFAGTYAPGYMRTEDTPPLYDPYWDPFWSACEELDMPIVVHAGYGWEQGHAFPALEDIVDTVAEAAGSRERDALFAHADAVPTRAQEFFRSFSNSLVQRRPLWQLALGGVFDRHPNLKLLLTEIRADWIPTTLAHLDAVYEQHRDQLPAKRKPSEYWASNCMAGASFIHKAEVEMRHEIGVPNIAFGRDYPHPEGTWPNTKDWLHDAFAGVPEDELRAMLGGNMIRFFNLDEARLTELARRIGPTYAEITTRDEVRGDLIDSFAVRGGYLKPAERDARLDDVIELVDEDLAGVAAGA